MCWAEINEHLQWMKDFKLWKRSVFSLISHNKCRRGVGEECRWLLTLWSTENTKLMRSTWSSPQNINESPEF